MKCVVVGAGELGEHVAKALSQSGYSVCVVERYPCAFADGKSIRRVQGHYMDHEVLRKAEVDVADLVVATTDNDELNMLAAVHAKGLGAKKVIAIARDAAHFSADRGVKADVMGQIDVLINPRMLAAVEMHNLIRSQIVDAIEEFADNQIEVVQLRVSKQSSVVGKALKELKLPKDVRVAAMVRYGDLIVPNSADAIEFDDEVYIAGRAAGVARLEEKLVGSRPSHLKRVFVVGGTNIGFHVASALDKDHVHVVLIESNRQRCFELASELGSHVQILNGDGTNLHLLEEEGVADADVFLACGAEPAQNLMAALLAKQVGARATMAVVDRPEHVYVGQRLGIDVSFSRRDIVARQVLRYARRGVVHTMRPMGQGAAVFLELSVVPGSRVVGRRVCEVDWPRGGMVCAILEKGRAILAQADSIFRAGQRAVVVCPTPRRRAVERLFKPLDRLA